MKVKTKFLMITILISSFIVMFFHNESFAVPDYGEPGSYNTAFSIDLVCESLENYEVEVYGDYGYETRVYSKDILDEDFYVKIASLVDMGETIETSSFGILNYVGTEEIVGRHCYIYTADITDKTIFENKIVEDLRYSEYNFKFYYEISIKETINISGLDIDINTKNKDYTGEEIKTSIIIKDDDYILIEGTDYKVSYGNNKYPGVATIKIVGQGIYGSEFSQQFNITTSHEYVIENEEVTITRGHCSSAILNIPAYINGYPVTKIKQAAFAPINGRVGATNVTTIIFPNTLKEIGNIAFQDCTLIENIEIPDSVEIIGTGCFTGCTGIRSVKLSEKLTTIESAVFKECNSLSEINIPDGVVSIGINAFYGCDSLTKIEFPDSLKNIEESSFENSGVEELLLPTNIESIGKRAFANCNLVTLIIPDSIKEISDEVFYNCENLSSIKFSDNLEYIGKSAFNGCKKLSYIEFSNTLKTIDDNAFNIIGESGKKVKVVIPESVVLISNNAFNSSTAIIYGYKNSYAQQYSEENLITFKKICTVVFKDYDDTILDTQIVYEDEAANAPEVTKREGYIFKQWSTDISSIKDDIEVKAEYSKLYIVRFKDYDGTILKEEQVEEGKNATAPENPSREGYIFKEWDLEYSNILSDLEVRATYTKLYAVIFKDYDGTTLKEEVVKEGESATAPADPSRETHIFTGWDKEFENVKSDLEIIAKYREKNEYTVVFKDYDGTILKEEKVKEGKNATAPENPFREGYVFKEWNIEYSNIISDLEVTAIYTKLYTVIFKDYNGTILKEEQVKEGESATAPVNPSRKGYTFSKWDADYFKIDNDLIVTAIYSKNDNTFEVGRRRETTLSTTNTSYNDTYYKAYWTIENDSIAKIKSSGKTSSIVGSYHKVVNSVTLEGKSLGETYLYLKDESGNVLITSVICVISITEDISSLSITDISAQTYTGEEIKPNISIKSSDGRILGKDIDYTISYSNNINKGTATVTIKGIDTYKGEITKTFEINTKDIFTLENNISTTAQDYNGEELKADIWFKHNDYKLVEGKDYTVSYSNNKYPGTATFTITGLGNYSGTTTKEFKINKGYVNITYSYNDNSCWYDGKKHTGSLSITSPKNAIVKYMDSNGNYTLDEMPQYTDVGVYKIKYRIFVNDYYTDVFGEQTLTINKSYLNNYSSDYEGVYDGKEHAINIKVDIPNYDIKYSINNNDYNLNSLPSFKDVGDYTINYKITSPNYNDLVGSNKVRIYGVKQLDSTLEIRNNMLIVKNYKNNFTDLCNRIQLHANSKSYLHLNQNKNVINDLLVRTGEYIQLIINNSSTLEYKVSVLADVNGDGKISALDYVKIKNHIMKTNLISSDVYLTAADVNDDGKISALDYVRIKNYIMNGGV